jgi:hypothetical protein
MSLMKRLPLALLAMLATMPLLSGCAMWFPKAPTGIYQTRLETHHWQRKLEEDPQLVPYDHRPDPLIPSSLSLPRGTPISQVR